MVRISARRRPFSSRPFLYFSFLGVFCLVPRTTYAGFVTYTDEAQFLSAAGPVSTLNFDSLAVGTLIPSGNSVAGITFSYGIAGLTMAVVNDFDTTSGANSLGLSDPGNFNQFVAGDSFALSFAPSRALGLYVITTADPSFAGDMQLATPQGTANNAGTPNRILPDGGTAFFVGIRSDASFSSAQLQFAPGAVGTFLYNVDDIQRQVPEPSTTSLALPAGCLISVWRLRWNR